MRKGSLLAAIVCSFLLGLAPLAAAPMVERGIDVFTTPADGRTFYDFAKNPIPAGFFCRDSKAFRGRIAFKGLPLATEVPGQLGSADTVVERLDDAVFDGGGTATTRIKFRALSLVSIAPVKTSCGSFHAYVSLGGKQRETTMYIQRTQESGGTFVAPLAVDVRLTFIPVQPGAGKNPRKLELTQRVNFPATTLPWSVPTAKQSQDSVMVDTNGDLIPDTRLPGLSNFSAGRSPRSQDKYFGGNIACCYEYVCHSAEGHEHCTWAFPEGCNSLCP